MDVKLKVAVPQQDLSAAENLPFGLADEVCEIENLEGEDFWIREESDLVRPLSDFPLPCDRIVIEGELVRKLLPQALLAMASMLVDWQGSELCVRLPGNEDATGFLRSIADLLRALELRARGVRLISCPTCARCHTDILSLARRLGARLETITEPLDVAIMGCEVNGPGEARAADVGIAFGRGVGLLFRRGEIVKRVPQADAEDALLEEVKRLCDL